MVKDYNEDDELDELAELEEDEKATYEELVEALPPREVEEGARSAGGGESLSDRVMSRADMSDMQTVFSELFPESLGTKVTNKLMVGRIEPSALLSLNNLLATNEVMMCNPEQDVNVAESIVRNYVLLTIGLDGRGRIDAEELAGAAREEKMIKERLRD